MRELARLKTTAKQTSLIGIFITVILVCICVTLYFFHEKIVFMLNESSRNSTNASNESFISTPTTTLLFDGRFQSKHKLHFESPRNSQGDINDFSFFPAAKTTSSTTNKLANISQPMLKQPTTELSKSTAVKSVTSTTNRFYDQLNILIDHDLFTSLLLKYKMLKDSNFINVTGV
jgi:hypothetical protein